MKNGSKLEYVNDDECGARRTDMTSENREKRMDVCVAAASGILKYHSSRRLCLSPVLDGTGAKVMNVGVSLNQEK